MTKKELEQLGLIHHSQEKDKGIIIDYYDVWEYPKVRLELEQTGSKVKGCLYRFGKIGIETLFEGNLKTIDDVEFILNRCLAE